MPLGILEVYQEEMEKIDAAEKLSVITSFAVGSGNLKRGDSTRIMNRLQRAAEGGQKKESVPISPATLAGVGIGIEIVKKEDKG